MVASIGRICYLSANWAAPPKVGVWIGLQRGKENMPLPRFLAPHHQVHAYPGASGGAAAGPPGGSRKLSLSVQPQEQTRWCWAAVSTSVSLFYSPAATWTQCSVANATLQRADCCGNGAADPGKCNRDWYLDRALNATDNLDRVEPRPLVFDEVKEQIANDAVIGTRVAWRGGGGHFQTIVGWLVAGSGVEYIEISDPIYLDIQMVFSQFATHYQWGGDWTHSYLTRRPSAGGAGTTTSSQPFDSNALGG